METLTQTYSNTVGLADLHCNFIVVNHLLPCLQTSDIDPASTANGGSGTKRVEQPQWIHSVCNVSLSFARLSSRTFSYLCVSIPFRFVAISGISLPEVQGNQYQRQQFEGLPSLYNVHPTLPLFRRDKKTTVLKGMQHNKAISTVYVKICPYLILYTTKKL